MQVTGKTIVVTGGSSGLGLCIAKKLLEKGAIVHMLGRNPEELAAASASINSPNLHTITADVTNASNLKEVLGVLELDALINNAGIWVEGSVEENAPEQISNVIDVNLKGVIYATGAVLPNMKKKNSGLIFNVVSSAGLVGRKEYAVYAASKFGVTGFTKSLELDLADTGIHVLAIYPRGINTGLYAHAGSARSMEGFLDPEEVADIIVFMIEHEHSALIKHLEVESVLQK